MLRLTFPLLLPLTAWAGDAANPGIPAGTYVQAMLALLLIVGLLFGTAWLARKLSGGKGFGQGGMKIVGGVALGPRERIVLVEVGETWSLALSRDRFERCINSPREAAWILRPPPVPSKRHLPSG